MENCKVIVILSNNELLLDEIKKIDFNYFVNNPIIFKNLYICDKDFGINDAVINVCKNVDDVRCNLLMEGKVYDSFTIGNDIDTLKNIVVYVSSLISKTHDYDENKLCVV